jgi:Tfp pilus assembly protein PilV
MKRTKRNNYGFNMVETVVASVILSGSVLTVGAISTRALTATRVNRQYEIAASLIDKQLSLIDYAGIEEFIELGQLEGDLTEIEPGYHWQVVTEYQDIDSLYLVRITVTWIENNRPHSLTVDTMLNGVSMYVNGETETQTTTEQE